MRKKVLIVDDSAELRELFRLYLQGAGYVCATASNGVDGLQAARAFSPDAIVLDLVMPELDGLHVCEALRGDPGMARVPVILLTSLSSELTRLAALHAGANDYVTKPVTEEELVSKVRQWLKRSRGSRSSDDGAMGATVTRQPFVGASA